MLYKQASGQFPHMLAVEVGFFSLQVVIDHFQLYREYLYIPCLHKSSQPNLCNDIQKPSLQRILIAVHSISIVVHPSTIIHQSKA